MNAHKNSLLLFTLIVLFFLRSNTSIAEQSDINQTLLHAAKNCDADAFGDLLDKYPNNAEKEQFIIQLATETIKHCTQHQNGSTVLEKLADSNPTIFSDNKQNSEGVTLLLEASLEAAKTGSLNLLKAALEDGADPLAKNNVKQNLLSTLDVHTKIEGEENLKSTFSYNQNVKKILHEYAKKLHPDFDDEPNWLEKKWYELANFLLEQEKELEDVPFIDPRFYEALKKIFSPL